MIDAGRVVTLYLPGLGPVVEVLAYSRHAARVVLNDRGRPCVVWVPSLCLRVVP